MADAATQRLLEQIVLEYVQAGAMFTAYDVTVEARNRGGNVRHNDGRDVVHELFQQGRMGAAYTRTTVDVGAPVKPLLYHRFSDDATSYRAGSPGPAPQQSPPQKPGLMSRIANAIFGGAAPANPTAPPARPSPSPPQRQPPPQPPRPRPPRTLGLDTSPYLPISRDEIVDSMKGTNLWSSVWFGRRDLIPPADDKRTLIIDRAMVSQGILTREQVAEIHAVGAEMDLVRPDRLNLQHQAAAAGQAAVQQDRETRLRLKEEKKAASAEKKRQRAAAVAHRRATDIIFLGRGVSARLSDRTSDAAKLGALGLPILSTPAELADALGLKVPQLRWLAFHSDVAGRTHYVHFNVPKKSGGVRTLSAPHRRLAAAQQWVLGQILAKLPTEAPAEGFIPGHSILTNAQKHVGRRVVLNMDLEGFFPSIAFPRVRSVFQRAGYSGAVATILALLCTESPRRTVEFDGKPWHVATGPRGLPQGACTSPALSNQVARRLDKRLQGLARKFQLTYTRYADDLTLSGNDEMATRVGYLMARVRHIAQDEGFAVNERKSRVQRRNTAQSVTGLVVNDRPGVPRDEVRRIRAILHRARTEGLAAQNREQHPNFVAWLEGKIAYISMARPDVGARLREDMNRVRNPS